MIEIEKLNVTFHKGTPLENHVLKDLDLKVEDDDFVVILGSNGAGKSTLFNSILGLLPYTGTIKINGASIDKKKTHLRCRDIGVVYQDPMKGSSPNLTIAENLIVACPFNRLKKGFLAECQKDLARFNLGLEDHFRTKVKDLSGGMRQALSLG